MLKQKQHAFTLIELLVVVSIIALLIAILLPALGAARRTALNAQCLSRMHNCAVATNAFPVDNKGLLPYAFGGVDGVTNTTTGITGDGEYFTDYFEEYMEIGEDVDQDYYICPESTLLPGAGQKQLSYSCNVQVLSNAQRTDKFGYQVKLASVKRTTEVMALGDAAQNSGAGTSGPNYSGSKMGPFFNPADADTVIDITEAENTDGVTTNGYVFRFRHAGEKTGNAAFIDGHAEAISFGQLVQSNLSNEY